MSSMEEKSDREFRVIGPPGSGKTEQIKRYCQHLVREGMCRPEDILLSSFSKAAARELGSRVDIPEENTATLHSLAFRAIGMPPVAEADILRKEWNSQVRIPSWEVLDPRGEGTSEDERGVPDEKRRGDQLKKYNLARAREVPEGHYLMTLTANFRREWEAFKKETESVDFNDMIGRAIEETTAAPGDPLVLIMDEAQDLSKQSFRLARQWGDPENVDEFRAVGDGAQTIFGFAGADPDAFLRKLPPERQQLLGTEKSYRLPSKIKDFAERHLRRHWGKGIIEGRVWAPRCEGGVVDRGNFGPNAPWALIDPLLQEIEEGRTSMVLATCDYMLRPTVKLLREAGIPFWNPYRTRNGSWNPLPRSRRMGNGKDTTSTSDRLLAYQREVWRWIDVYHWASMLRASNRKGGINVFANAGVKKMLENKAKGEEAQTLVDVASDIMPLFKPEAFDAIMREDLGWFSRHVTERYKRPIEYAANVVARFGLEALAKSPQVIIGTGHSVKGGEADNVFMFPDFSAAAEKEMEGPDGLQARDAMIRLGYVMMTRPREKLIIGVPSHPRRSFCG